MATISGRHLSRCGMRAGYLTTLLHFKQLMLLSALKEISPINTSPYMRRTSMTRAAAAEVPGILWIVQICKRAHIRLVPDILVIFGDNIQQKGYEGQAKEC